MSDYTKITNFAVKDSLPTTDPLKIITGTAHDDEYNAIAVAIATKQDAIHDTTEKTSIVDADEFAITDSASAYVGKRITWANLKSAINTYIGTIYQTLSNKDATGGYAGLTLFKINFKNAADTFTSFLTNSNTAARTYTFPDKDLTVAGIVDIPVATAATPLMDSGVGVVGTSVDFARADHQHPAVNLSGTKGIGIIKYGALNITQNTTSYLATIGTTSRSTTARGMLFAPRDITVSQLRVALSASVPAANSLVLTLMVNGIDTSLTCTVAATAQTAEDTTHSVKIPAGSWFVIKAVTSATFTSTNDVKASLVVKDYGNSYGVMPLFLSTYQTLAATSTFSDNAADVGQTPSANNMPMPACRVTEALQGIASATGLANATATRTIKKNAVEWIDTWLYAAAARKELFVAGDTFNAGYTTNVLAATPYSSSLIVDSYEDGYYPPTWLALSAGSQAQSTTTYLGGYAAISQSGTEANVSFPMPACTLRNLRAITDSASAGGTCVFTVRKNGVDTALTATIAVSALTGEDLTNTVTFAAGDLLSVSSVAGVVGTRNYTITAEVIE